MNKFLKALIVSAGFVTPALTTAAVITGKIIGKIAAAEATETIVKKIEEA